MPHCLWFRWSNRPGLQPTRVADSGSPDTIRTAVPRQELLLSGMENDMAVKPVLQALILADRVYEDKASGKKIIAGTFNKLLFKRKAEPPKVIEGEAGEKKAVVQGGQQAGSPYAYISLTEVRGQLPMILRYVSLADNRSLMETQFTVTSDDPLKTIELVLPLPKLPMQGAGPHALELLCENEPVGSLRVMIEELP